jgi:hypothetical protein
VRGCAAAFFAHKCWFSVGKCVLAPLPVLIALKRAHIFWPINWEKHIADLHNLLNLDQPKETKAVAKRTVRISSLRLVFGCRGNLRVMGTSTCSSTM